MKLAVVVFLVAAAFLVAITLRLAVPRPTDDVASALAGAQSWGYQLQNVDPEVLAASGVDVLVIDYSRDGSQDGRLTPDKVEVLKVKPDGTRRVVLSYLSIGEAEDYRDYWDEDWHEIPPSWLGKENPAWPGNYAVDYWDAAWQSQIFGQQDALLDIIIAQGFDGVYLDRIDAFDGGGQFERRAMMTFVADLSAYGRDRAPGLLIIQQNAEDLLDDEKHRAVIDGLAKEDLFFGVTEPGLHNPQEMISSSVNYLERLAQEGKPVFVVEYDLDATAQDLVQVLADEHNYVLTFASRALDVPPEYP